MQDFGTKADNSPPPGGQLSAAEFNNLATENENAVLRSGQSLDGLLANQLAQSLFLHSVKASSFQDSGTANAYVVTPISGINGVLLPGTYAPLDGALIVFSAANANSGASTLNIGQTTGTLIGVKKILTQAGAALPSGVLVAGRFIQLKYDSTLDSGVGAWALMPWSTESAAIQGAFKNLSGSATGLSAAVSYAIDEIIVESTLSSYKTLRAVSIAPSLASSGANGLDTGTSAVSSWYSVWVIWNGTTTSGLLSLSATAPTMPSGYTHRARIGWVRTDATANKFPLCFQQNGKNTQLNVVAGTNVAALPTIASGILGNPAGGTYVTAAISSFCPPTASMIDTFSYAYAAGAQYAVANSSGYSSPGSASNPPPVAYVAPTVGSSVDFVKSAYRFIVTGANLYVCASTSDFLLKAIGWEDNL